MQVCVEPRTSALSLTLPARRCRRHWRPGCGKAATRRCCLLSINRRDRQTDRPTRYRFRRSPLEAGSGNNLATKTGGLQNRVNSYL